MADSPQVKKTQHANNKSEVSDNWFKTHRVWTALIGLFVLGIVLTATNSDSSVSTASKSSNVQSSGSTTATAQSKTKQPAPPKRQVQGTAVTLGAGSYTGGKDVAVGLYDVTPGAGQSGNFIVNGTDSYNEILGGDISMGDVPKVRTKISSGDKIEISGLSSVTFAPVNTPFVTSYKAEVLYAGKFIVGEDIAAGRYVVKPGAGQSGNFIVSGADSYNEILGGDSAYGGVPSLTVNLTDKDIIEISSLSQVSFTAAP